MCFEFEFVTEFYCHCLSLELCPRPACLLDRVHADDGHGVLYHYVVVQVRFLFGTGLLLFCLGGNIAMLPMLTSKAGPLACVWYYKTLLRGWFACDVSVIQLIAG